MFVRINCAFWSREVGELNFEHRSLDASCINMIMKGRHEGHIEFWFHAGDGDGLMCFTTDSYDEAGLVELIMQARLYPDQFLPSNNVGKDKAEELGSTGSLHWSAKEAAKKRKGANL